MVQEVNRAPTPKCFLTAKKIGRKVSECDTCREALQGDIKIFAATLILKVYGYLRTTENDRC